jgi:hypothetical protein
MATEQELRDKWRAEHPFAPAGTEPDFARMVPPSGAQSQPAPAPADAPQERPATAKQLERDWEQANPFTSGRAKPDFQKIADEAVTRYERGQAAQREAAEQQRAAAREAYNPDLEQLWAAIRRLQSGSGGGGGGVTPPFWLTAPDTTHLKVQFGQVNGITPSGGWAGGGNDVGVSVDASGWTDGTYNIYLDATLGSDGIPTAVTITKSTSAVPSNTSTHAYMLIGTAVLASGVVGTVSPSLAWSQTFVACGRDSADPTTTPGTYYWEVA